MELTVANLRLRNKLQTKGGTVGGSLNYRLVGSRLWILWDKDARVRHVTGGNTLAQDKGDADYLSTRGAKGNRWKHFGNQGRQSDT